MAGASTQVTQADMQVPAAFLVYQGTVAPRQNMLGGNLQFCVWADSAVAGSTLGTDTFALQMSPDEGATWLTVGPNTTLSSSQQVGNAILQRGFVRCLKTGTSSTGVSATLKPVGGQ